ncbi:MAG: MFS transporter [Phycisphaerales bacterium]|nr:MFS transporter [Phycisphaerales bacterium]
MPQQVSSPRRSPNLPYLADSGVLRLLTLCGLYVAQGLPWGFIAVAITATLAARGLDPGEIAQVTILATLPWSFKWIWGPLIDRFRLPIMGRRRPWILLAQSGMILVLLLLAAVPALTEDLGSLKYAIFFVNCFASLQDVSVDALAVDLLKPEERGRANGLMYGSSYAGNALGGAGLGVLAALVSLQFAFLILAICVALIMLLPLLLRERPGDQFLSFRRDTRHHSVDTGCQSSEDAREDSGSDRPCRESGQMSPPSVEGPGSLLQVLGLFLRAFSILPTQAGLLLALLASITTGLFGAFMSPLMIQELGWTQVEYTSITGSIVFVGLGGSIVGGFLADLVGPRRLAMVSGLGMALVWFVMAMTPHLWSVRPSMITYMIMETALGGMFSVSLFALFMGISWKKMAATQFTTYMAMLNLSRILGATLATKLDELDVTYEQVFLLSTGVTILAVLVLPIVSPLRAQRKFNEMESGGV